LGNEGDNGKEVNKEIISDISFKDREVLTDDFSFLVVASKKLFENIENKDTYEKIISIFIHVFSIFIWHEFKEHKNRCVERKNQVYYNKRNIPDNRNS
jgi:hypothetical protein